MQVNQEMLETMLDAALSTARRYRGRNGEMYALGQLESTANLIYVMICCQDRDTGFAQLEVRCHSCALEAVERMSRLADGDDSYSLKTA